MWLCGRSDHTLPAVMLAVLEKFGGPVESKKQFAEQAAQLETRINDMLGELSVGFEWMTVILLTFDFFYT